VPDGQYTQTIYSLIRDQKYMDVIDILSAELQFQPRNRAALSLLGYCYFQVQDYVNAADCYDQLTKFFVDCDNINNYRLYHAQSLFKSGVYTDAQKVLQMIEAPEYEDRILQLQCAIQYELEEISQATSYIN
jgi:tetratricopeptide repeat protein 30